MNDDLCGHTDPLFRKCSLLYDHVGIHDFTIDPPEEHFEDEGLGDIEVASKP